MTHSARLSTVTLLVLLSAVASVDPNRPLALLKKDVQIQTDRLVIAANRRDASQIKPFLYKHPAVKFGDHPRAEGTTAVLAAFRDVFEDVLKFEVKTDSVMRDGVGRFVLRGRLAITLKTPDGSEVANGLVKLVWKFVGDTPRLVFVQSSFPPPPPPTRSDKLLIEDVLVEAERYVIAYNRGDANQLGRFYAADAVLKIAGEGSVSGRNAIVKALAEMIGDTSGLEGETKNVKKVGDRLFEQSGTYSLMERMDGKVTKVSGTFRFVWRFDGARPVLTIHETN